MSKYLPYILAGLLAIAVWQLIVMGQTIKGLKQSAEIVNEALEDQKEENQKIIDSLIKASKEDVIEAQDKAIDSVIKAWRKRPKTGSYDPYLNTSDALDSAEQLFTRHFPNN